MSKKVFIVLLTLFFYMSVKGQSLTFSGKVTDDGSKGIAGAEVAVLNTNFVVLTNDAGEFLLKGIPGGKYTIRIHALGYAAVNKQVLLSDLNRQMIIHLPADNKQLDEVLVTAQKREEDPQQVPFSISTLSAKQVKDYKLWNTRDLTAIIPNLYSASPGDNRNVTSVRGIATTSYDQAVATYIDGVNQFGLDTYIAQLEDVERIEVLRGPQGTLYGRNAMGGVINIITKQPGNETRGLAGLDIGNYGLQRYHLALRAPLVKNKLFFGVSGLFNKLDGFYTNQFNNTKFDKQNSFTGNYYLKFVASPRLSLTLNVKHAENRNDGTFPLASSVEEALTNPFKLNQDAQTKLIDNVFNSSLSVNYFGRDFNFSSQTAYQSNYRYYNQPIDGDFSPIDGVTLINNYGHRWNNVKVGTQEFRFSSPASSGSAIKWTAGSYAFYQDNPVKQGTHFGQDAGLMGAEPNSTSINTSKAGNFGLAFFGQATYNITPSLEFSVGLRYDYEHKKQTVKGELQMDSQDPVVIQADTSSFAGFRAFSPKASLAYHLTENHHLYAIYSRGFRAGGITQLSSDRSQPKYKPEYSNNMEVGTKNTFLENRLRLNVSAFYTRVTDAQLPVLILPDAVTVTRNGGKLGSKGVEMELVYAALKSLELEYNFGYTYARYTDLEAAADGSAVVSEGNHQVFTPDVTSMLALQYGYDLIKEGKLKLIMRGEWKYLGKQYFDLSNQIEQNGYSLFNARIGVSSSRFDVFLWGENLGNKKYIDYAYDFGAAHLGDPKTYGISIMARF